MEYILFVGGVMLVGWLTNTLAKDIKRHRVASKGNTKVPNRPQSLSTGGISEVKLSKPQPTPAMTRLETAPLKVIPKQSDLPTRQTINSTTLDIPKSVNKSRGSSSTYDYPTYDVDTDFGGSPSRHASHGYTHASHRNDHYSHSLYDSSNCSDSSTRHHYTDHSSHSCSNWSSSSDSSSAWSSSSDSSSYSSSCDSSSSW